MNDKAYDGIIQIVKNAEHSYIDNVERINISLAVRKGAPSYFYRAIVKGINRGVRTFKVRIIDQGKGLYPNFCVPVAGIIKYFEENHSCTFLPSKSMSDKSLAGKIGILHPYSDVDVVNKARFLSKIWVFDENNQYKIVQGIRDSLRQAIPLQRGLLNCLELCLNEVMDNVLIHSGPFEEGRLPSGLVMAQVHPKGKRIAIAVYDNGIGMMESLSRGGVQCPSAQEAISMALEKGVTDGNGKGNGLWLLNEVVKRGEGSLEIASSGMRYSFWHQDAGDGKTVERASFSKALSAKNNATLVDFQLSSGKAVDVNELMEGIGYVDLWKEAHEDAENQNNHRLSVLNDSAGLGTRHDAEMFRMLAINSMNDTDGLVIFDFAGIEIISFSFADEAFRMLKDEVGEETFKSRFAFDNLNGNCKTVVALVVGAS